MSLRHRHCLIEGFLSAIICDRLCEAFRHLSSKIINRASGFWDERFLWYSDIRPAYPELGAYMIDAQRRATQLVSGFYQLSRPIYPDLLQIMQWAPGLSMPPHSDNSNPDGAPHEMAHRDFSVVIYLNDDYKGGEFRFTKLDVTIRPRKGLLLAFTAGDYHEHAVLRVEGSQRLTMPFFLTFDRGHADPSLL